MLAKKSVLQSRSVLSLLFLIFQSFKFANTFLFYLKVRRDVSVDTSNKEKFISLAMVIDNAAVRLNFILLKNT